MRDTVTITVPDSPLPDFGSPAITLASDLPVPAGEMKLELVEFIYPDDSQLSSDEMLARANNRGAVVSYRLLAALEKQQRLIPESWRHTGDISRPSATILALGTIWNIHYSWEEIGGLSWSPTRQKWSLGRCAFGYWATTASRLPRIVD